MAPNKRKPGRVLVGAWVSEELKAQLVARAKAEGLTVSDAATHAIEQWLQKPGNAEKPPTAR